MIPSRDRAAERMAIEARARRARPIDALPCAHRVLTIVGGRTVFDDATIKQEVNKSSIESRAAAVELVSMTEPNARERP